MPDFKLDSSPPPSQTPPETPIPDSAIFTESRTPEDDTGSGKKGRSLFSDDTESVQKKKVSLFDSSPESDSDDMFKTDKTKVVTADLFAKDDGLFGTRKAPPAKKADTIDIFNDDGDDMFSSKKLPPKSDIMKKSLFDDDDLDDEEDIFGAASSSKANGKR